MEDWREAARDREFQLWEYCVSKGRLLLRSPAGNVGKGIARKNLDLVAWDTVYLDLPTGLRGLAFDEPTTKETARISQAIGTRLDGQEVRVIVSGGRRYSIAAWKFQELTNEKFIMQAVFWTERGRPDLDFIIP